MRQLICFCVSLIVLLYSSLFPPAVYAEEPSYTVQSGDCLWNIGQRFGYSVSFLARLNHITNPDLIFPGQVIRFASQDAVDFALEQLGKPYIWGGTGPRGYDCSGLVSKSYQLEGLYLPHNAYLQWIVSTDVQVPQRGDLAFYGDGNRIVHVGIMVDSVNMIHATSRYGKIVIEPALGYSNFLNYGRVI